MKKQFKNLISSIALLAVLCVGYATVSFGAPSHGVSNTKHNLSTGGQFGGWKSTNESEVCVFCHTPHNSAPGKQFLWNRINTADVADSEFVLYTSSPTLNFSSPAAPSSVSKMCMSCHDGATSLNSMANPRGAVMTGYDQLGDLYWGEEPAPPGLGWGANIGNADIADVGIPAQYNYQVPAADTGGLLLNDHPISFLYKESCDADATIKKTGADCNGSSIGGLPLWWSNDNGLVGYKVECVTCHDPHINYVAEPAYAPFLRKANSSSNLCFTCHDK